MTAIVTIMHNDKPIIHIHSEGFSYAAKLCYVNFKPLRGPMGMPVYSRTNISSLKLAILGSLLWLKKNSSMDINSFITVIEEG